MALLLRNFDSLNEVKYISSNSSLITLANQTGEIHCETQQSIFNNIQDLQVAMNFKISMYSFETSQFSSNCTEFQ